MADVPPQPIAPEPEANLPPEHLSPAQIILRRLRREKLALAGGALLTLLYFIALLAGFIAPYDYERQDRARFFHPPIWPRLINGKFAVPHYAKIEGQFAYEPVAGD